MKIQTFLKSESINHRMDLINLVRTGLDSAYIKQVQELTSLTESELSTILSVTLEELRGYQASQKLNKVTSSKLIQLFEFFQKGYMVFGEEKFKLWIRTPNATLNQALPLDILDTPFGIDIVKDVIGRIEHGVYN